MAKITIGRVLSSGTDSVTVVGTVTANQGAPAAAATAWMAKITDGTDVANITAAGAVQVDGSGVTQPISAASLPLPTGAATAAGQTTQATALNQISGLQKTRITDGVDDALVSAAGALLVDGSGVTQPVSAASLPLPAGAATAANQATEIASLSVMDDWDEADRAKANIIVGQAGVQAGAGVVTANTQRVAIVTDQTAVPVVTTYGEYKNNSAPGNFACIAGQRDDAPAELPDDVNVAAVRITDQRELMVNLRSANAEIGVVGNPLAVSAASLPLPTGAATEASLAAVAASASVLDDWDETDRAKVNLIAGQAGVTGGAGAVAANTQRTTLASDDPAVTSLQLIDDAVNAINTALSKAVAVAGQLDDVGSVAATENNVAPCRITSGRALHVQLRGGATPTSEVGIKANPLEANAAVQGTIAHDGAAVSVFPLLNGGYATRTRPASVSADNDAVRYFVDREGRQVTRHDFFSVQDTFTATGNGTAQDASQDPRKYYSMQVTMTGAVTSWDVRLEISNDGTNWTQIAQHTNAVPGDGQMVIGNAGLPYPAKQFRTRCAGLVLGAGTNVVCQTIGTV